MKKPVATISHSPTALSYLIDVAGADRAMLGSDDGFDMGDEDPVAAVERVKLAARERERILHGNARALLGLR